MYPTSLAQELNEEIIGHISDKRNLLLCSLVSRSFLHAARRNLFEKLEVTQYNVSTLSTILDSPFCTFPCYVRHLLLFIPLDSDVDDYENNSRHWVHGLIPHLKNFPNISSLTMGIDSTTFFDAVCGKYEIFTSLPKLTSLSLRHVSFYPGEEDEWDLPSKIFNLIPSSGQAHFYDIESSRVRQYDAGRQFPCYLHTLVIYNLSANMARDVTSLHTLELMHIQPDYVAEFGQVIYGVRESLQRLAFGLSDDYISDSVFEEVTLRHNNKLLVLHLNSLGTLEQPDKEDSDGGHVPLLLSDVNLESLQELYLDLRSNSTEVFSQDYYSTSPVWDDIARIILDRFTGLQKIVITVSFGSIKRIKALVREDFDPLVRNGVLLIVAGGVSRCEMALVSASDSDSESAQEDENPSKGGSTYM